MWLGHILVIPSSQELGTTGIPSSIELGTTRMARMRRNVCQFVCLFLRDLEIEAVLSAGTLTYPGVFDPDLAHFLVGFILTGILAPYFANLSRK